MIKGTTKKKLKKIRVRRGIGLRVFTKRAKKSLTSSLNVLRALWLKTAAYGGRLKS